MADVGARVGTKGGGASRSQTGARNILLIYCRA